MTMSDNFSRRQVVGGVGLGLAAVADAVAPASAQTAVAAPTAAPMQDPVSKYPNPPFKRQTQPWPGLAGQMDPRPDHGETSYKGSGRLAGRKALITGGDFGMGRAAAIAYAREGADVAINYLPEEEPDAREVIALIKAEGGSGSPCLATSATRRSASSSWPMPSGARRARHHRHRTPAGSRATTRSWTSPPSNSTGR